MSKIVFLKGNGLKKLLEKFGGKKPDCMFPSPPTPKIHIAFGFNKTNASCCERLCLVFW